MYVYIYVCVCMYVCIYIGISRMPMISTCSEQDTLTPYNFSDPASGFICYASVDIPIFTRNTICFIVCLICVLMLLIMMVMYYKKHQRIVFLLQWNVLLILLSGLIKPS